LLWDQGHHFVSPRNHVKALKEGQSSYNLREHKHWKTKHDDKIIKDALNEKQNKMKILFPIEIEEYSRMIYIL
jgi:hypothetical protein